MSTKGWQRFYKDFLILVRWRNAEPIPGYSFKLGWRFEIWSPLETGKCKRKKVYALSQPCPSRAIALIVAQGIVDKIVVQPPKTRETAASDILKTC